MLRSLALVLPWSIAVGFGSDPARAQTPLAADQACAVATAEHPLPLEGPALIRPNSGTHQGVGAGEFQDIDYRQALRTTPWGWARLDRWCVWVEPPAVEGPAALWDGRWHRAVLAALATWQRLVPVTLVTDPDRAQIRIQRRRPPLQELDGRLRASHGRAMLRLVQVERQGLWRPEPQVMVLIGPGQGDSALQATALHELGHAFGLWGHSDRTGDALAAVPGARPVLALSDRDRRTLVWLYDQPTNFGRSDGPLPASGSWQ